MILFMILRHSLVDTVKDTIFGGVIAYYPLLFFMAWFFFKGGMYYREESLATCISKGITRLLVPYAVFSVIAVIVAMIVRGCLSGVSGVLQNTRISQKRGRSRVQCTALVPALFIPDPGLLHLFPQNPCSRLVRIRLFRTGCLGIVPGPASRRIVFREHRHGTVPFQCRV